MNALAKLNRTAGLFGVVAALMLSSCGGSETVSDSGHAVDAGEEAHAAQWGYEADNGPSHWSSMDPDWILCAEGLSQSPIDLTDAVQASTPTLDIDVPSGTQVTMLNQKHVFGALDNGHTIQINAVTGEKLTVGDQSYSLVQFHFHAPSEHTVNGEHFPMEMHFVHFSEEGKLTVIGVFIEEGAENPAISPIWAQLQADGGTQVELDLPSGMGPALFPRNSAVYHYSGSLTRPPCSEGVSWFVLKNPIQLSREQIDAFTAVYNHNNRPTQPLGERQLLVDDEPAVNVH